MPYIGNTAGNRFVASKTATQFSGDGSAVDFTLDHSVGSPEDILVSVDGVIQEPTVAYGIVSGTTLRFTAAPSNNSGNNIFVYYLFRTVATVDHPATSALSATSGTFSTNATIAGTLGVTGATTLTGALTVNDPIQILNGSNVNTASTDADDLIIEGPNDCGLSILSATTGRIFFGDASNDDAGSIRYVHTDDSMRFEANDEEAMRIHSIGAVTKPLQPSFMVYASGATNLSLNATYTIAFGTPIHDNNSDFASNTFTAPVTGKYQLNLTVRLDSLDDATQYYMCKIVTSNREYQNIHGNSGYDADVNYMNVNFSVVADMDASDTATAVVDIPSLGSAQVDVNGATTFSGFLVC